MSDARNGNESRTGILEMLVPHMDVVGENKRLVTEIQTAIEQVVNSGAFVLGEPVAQFERKIAEKIGVKHVIGVNSGTDALALILGALGVVTGSEVITVSNSFIATAGAIREIGGNVRFVDVGDDENMDPDSLEQNLTPGVMAIIAVHLRGRPAKMDRLLAICRAQNIPLIEDASQAFGARYRGRMVGTFGRAAAFSLHPQKILGALGDAGIVTTNDSELDDRIRLLRNHGLRSRDLAEMWGRNSRLDTLQAAILLTKLRYVDEWINARRSVAKRYCEGLANLPIVCPTEGAEEHHVYYGFSIFVDCREALLKCLLQAGIDARVHYALPIHSQPAAKMVVVPAKGLPAVEAQSARQLSLPIYPALSDQSVDYVISTIRNFFKCSL